MPQSFLLKEAYNGMMDLAKIGQLYCRLHQSFLGSARQEIVINIVFNVATEQEFFCEYGPPCMDRDTGS